MGEATRGELNLIDDLNEFVRQTSNQIEDVPETSGIRPHPQIEETETTLDTVRFGMNFGPPPEADVEPESLGGGGVPPPCVLDATLVCDSVSASLSKCGYTEFCDPSDPPKYYLNYEYSRVGTLDREESSDCPIPGAAFTESYTSDLSHVILKHYDISDPTDCVLITDSDTASSHNKTVFNGVTTSDNSCPSDGTCWSPVCCGDCSTGLCPSSSSSCAPTTQSSTTDYAEDCQNDFYCSPPGSNPAICHDVGTDVVTETLSTEYTTEMLIDNTVSLLPAYSDCFGCSAEMCSYPPGEDCSCTSSRDLSDDETSYAITRLEYKFTWADPAPESCTLTWCIQTTDFDGNILSTDEMSTVVDAGATETDVFELLEPSENGYSNIIYPVTGACCVSGVCSEQTESDCAGMSGTWAGTCTDCTTNPC